jgi:3-deoxy-D-manno-octulosonic-acid transferase
LRKSFVSASYLLYNVLATAALPLLPLWPRLRSGLGERFGFYSKSKLKTFAGARPIWIHASSVGETVAAGALIEALRRNGWPHKILLSTFTDTGNDMARRSAGANSVIYLPFDHPLAVRRALSKLDPAALVIIETEIWPNLLRAAAGRGIPVLLLSGRISERALARYRKFGAFFRAALRCFVAMGVQSATDAERLVALGANPAQVAITGNLKQSVAGAAEHADDASLDAKISAATGGRPLVVAGSTHRGEETTVLEAFTALRKRFPDLQLVLAPRHPERFPEVEILLRQAGVTFERKSRMAAAAVGADVLLLDTLGDLRSFYARADVTFVGGTLVQVGGHNLLEPAHLKKPVLFGPNTANVKEPAAALRESGGGIEVRNAGELAGALEALLEDPDRRRRAGESAYAAATRDHGVVERSLELVSRYVDVQAEHAAAAVRAGAQAA